MLRCPSAALVSTLLLAAALPAQPKTTLLRDINSLSVNNPASSPTSFVSIGKTTYFAALTASQGQELYKTDCTAAGTMLVADINPGPSHSSPRHLTAVGSTLYFTANDGLGGTELWKTDGTGKGTVMVKDIESGNGGSSPTSLVALGNTLLFAAKTSGSGYE
ncbi:MAG: ELWxxDGT repeat protein, partial [Planctomycetota bacterium]